jgi:uncharacterized protein
MKRNQPFTRRDFLKLSFAILPRAAALGLMMYLYGKDMEPNWIEITHVTLKLSQLAPAFDGLRIVQMSDFHLGHNLDQTQLKAILDLALAQQPDIFFLTGDYVDKYANLMSVEEGVSRLPESFSKLSAAHPTFAVLGNHDHRIGGAQIEQALTSAGVSVLRNSITKLQRNGSSLTIAGLDDVREKQDRLHLLLSQLPQDSSALLLAHEPDSADATSATGRFAVQFSGHTHGGQIKAPLLGPLYLPEWGRKYPEGLYEIGDMQLYTTRGLGTTSVSIRFNCRPEITVFTLESET